MACAKCEKLFVANGKKLKKRKCTGTKFQPALAYFETTLHKVYPRDGTVFCDACFHWIKRFYEQRNSAGNGAEADHRIETGNGADADHREQENYMADADHRSEEAGNGAEVEYGLDLEEGADDVDHQMHLGNGTEAEAPIEDATDGNSCEEVGITNYAKEDRPVNASNTNRGIAYSMVICLILC